MKDRPVTDNDKALECCVEWLLLVVAINCCMPADRYSLFGAGWIAVYIMSIDRK